MRPERRYLALVTNNHRISQTIIEIARRLDSRHLVAGSEGNLTARTGPGSLLATPTGCSLGRIETSDLVPVDLEGRPKTEGRQPTSELPLHLQVYRSRPEIGAVVHAHPPYSTALALTGTTLDHRYLPEVAVLIGPIPLVRYATPGSPELAARLKEHLPDHNAFLLENHGLITIGESLNQAAQRMEIVEQAARVMHLARQVGTPRRLSEADLARLEALTGRNEKNT